MGVLEQVIKMKNQGRTEREIINELSQNRVSPKEINDALRQAQIKNAVSNPMEENEELKPSIMPEEEIPSPIPASQETYKPRAQRTYEPQEFTQQEQYTPQEYPSQAVYQPQEQYYPPESYGYSPAGIDSDTVMEIADQVFSDKIKKFQKQLDTTSETAALLQTKTENVSERLKKIETTIDKLQIAILEKVGSYGQNLESIRKEMSMMQDSFSKMVSSPKKEAVKRKTEKKISIKNHSKL
jgi:hypothetical protein